MSGGGAPPMNMSKSNGSPELQSFSTFVEHWLVQQNKYLEKLISVSKHHMSTQTNLGPLINGVIEHYEQYYEAKLSCVKQDVLGMLTPSWTSTLEDAFMWIGGWRPTVAIHLFYSKSGLQLDGQLANLIRGLGTCDLGDLSPTQLTRVDELQRRTIKEERDITEKMAKIQETVTDQSMVELSHKVTELISSGGPSGGGGGGGDGNGDGDGDGLEERVKLALASKEEVLEEILHKADDLRMRTLKALLDVFTPLQAVHFLIAATELQLRVHDWGLKKDTSQVHATCRA